MKKEEDNELFPPHIETYQKLGEYVYVSDLHQGTERAENIRLATFLAEKTKEKIFILPIIQPLTNNADLRNEYLPKGVKKDKNPDFYFRARFVDGKNMTTIDFTDNENKLRAKIQGRLKEAFKQANDALVEVPLLIDRSIIYSSVNGQLNPSKNNHIVYIKYGEEFFTIKKPDK